MAGGYDNTLTISRMTNLAQSDILRLTGPGSGHLGGSAMDAFDHDLNYNGDGLLDDVNTGIPSIPFTPAYELSDTFSATFEDPFSYQSGPFDSLLDDAIITSGNESTADLDNKLLSFGAPILKVAILDDAGQTWPQMSAELYGMFFVAEDVFGGETGGRPMELTCYRRNLFQISGSVSISRGIKGILNDQGQHVPVYDLMASISALESMEGKSTEIISVPWKTNNSAIASEDKARAAPPKCPLDLSINPELDPTCVSIPIAWKRLQFKHATANNGRRKGLQQHYVIQINLTATLSTGEIVKLAEIRSGPIIVRGRSPRNFDSRKDVSLGERKLDPKQRTLSDPAPPVKVDPSVGITSYQFYGLNPLEPLDLTDLIHSNISLPSTSTDSSLPLLKKPLLSTNLARPPVPKTYWTTESAISKSTQPSAPIDLSLADDELGRSNSFSLPNSSRVGDASPQLGKRVTTGSPIESADLLYEYFPLSLDDWMPPVDAIYRPHVVHHTTVPPDLKAQQVKNKTKRYFTAED